MISSSKKINSTDYNSPSGQKETTPYGSMRMVFKLFVRVSSTQMVVRMNRCVHCSEKTTEPQKKMRNELRDN